MTQKEYGAEDVLKQLDDAREIIKNVLRYDPRQRQLMLLLLSKVEAAQTACRALEASKPRRPKATVKEV